MQLPMLTPAQQHEIHIHNALPAQTFLFQNILSYPSIAMHMVETTYEIHSNIIRESAIFIIISRTRHLERKTA